MARKDRLLPPPRPKINFSCTSTLLCLGSLVLLLTLFRSSSTNTYFYHHHPSSFQLDPVHPQKTAGDKIATAPCNFSDGKWIYHPAAKPTTRYDSTCKEIFKGWNCIAGKKSNALDILNWRWKPNACDLPIFDPLHFLERYRDSSIGFIGDSLNRNMFVSLFCTLKRVSGEVRKWRPAGADRGFTFLQYNLTIAYHRTNLLARYGRWSANVNGGSLESLGYREGYRVDVDIPEGTWDKAPGFHDILIFNTGHWWWAPSKFDPVKSPMLFFEKGFPVIPPPASADIGLHMVLKHMVSFTEQTKKRNAVIFFRSQSPRHFEGGDWDQGGSCKREQPLSSQEVEELFSQRKNGTNGEVRVVNQHLHMSLRGSGFKMLDVTGMSEFRADAHPSSAGGKKHDDCMHWCLPGLTDIWNDLFVAHLSQTYNL